MRKYEIHIIVLLFTLLQLVVLFVFGYTPYPDSNGYILFATEALKEGEIYPTLHQLYVHPFLWNIGAINAVEASLFLFDSILPLLVLYSLLKGLTAWVIYAIALHITNRKTALIALLIYVLYPANYGEGTSVLSELPFLFLSLSGIYLSFKGRYLPGGLLFAVANWFRPMAIIFLLSICVYHFFNTVSKKEAGRKIALTLSSYILTILLIGGATWLRTDRFFTQAQTGWMALMQYSWNHDSDKEPDYAYFYQGDPMLSESSHFDCLQRDSLWRSHFLIWIQHNVDEYVSQMPRKVADTYVSDNVNLCTFIPDKSHRSYMYEEISMPALIQSIKTFPSTVQLLTMANLIFYYFLLIAGMIGFCQLWKYRKYRELSLPLSVVLTGTLLLVFFGHGETRFHIPFMPFIIILSAICMTGYCRQQPEP